MRWLVLSAVLIFSGCSTVGEIVDAQKICAADEECLADTKKLAKVGAVIASPWGGVASNAAESVLVFSGLIYFGLKLKKKKKETP